METFVERTQPVTIEPSENAAITTHCLSSSVQANIVGAAFPYSVNTQQVKDESCMRCHNTIYS